MPLRLALTIFILLAPVLRAQDVLLWYDKPAGNDWLSALPLGNGRIGAMLYGNPDREHLQLNEDTLYALEPQTSMYIPNVRQSLPEVIALLKDGKYREAQSFVTKNWLGRSNAPYQPLGDLFIDFGGGAVRGYRRSLDLRDAVARVEYQRDGVTFRREVFISHPDQVLVIRVMADKPASIQFRAWFETPHKPTTTYRADAGTTFIMRGQLPGEALRRDLVKQVEAWGDQRKYPAFYEPDGKGGFRRKFDEKKVILYGKDADGRGMFFESRIRVVTDGGKTTATDSGIEVTGANSATLVLSVGTSFNGFDKSPSREGVDPAVRAKADLEAAIARPFEQLRQRHVEDYSSLFGRVQIQLGNKTEQSALPTDQRVKLYQNGKDASLAGLYYQFGRYLMIAGSRPGTQPLNLQGIWNNAVIPPWNAGYTVNINTEMNYWNAGRGNLLECEEPLMRLVLEGMLNGQRVAKEMLGYRGWCMSHNCSIWREAAPVDGNAQASWWPMAAGWFAQHIWHHYEFTQDRAFLARMYPAMKGASEFFLDWLIDRGDGRLVTPVSTSPENSFRYADGGRTYSAAVSRGSTMDMAIIRELFRNTVSAAEILNVDPAFRKQLQTTLPRLLGYQVGRFGQLQEWEKDFDEAEPTHRHLSHLYGYFPGDEITPERTPDLVKAVRATLARRGDGATGWSMGWKLCIWARMEDGAHFEKLLAGLLTPQRTAPNLFDLHPPFQIDGNFGAARGIAETLVQDHRGCIHLLPALPPVWPSGHVRGLRARGGYEVSMQWQDGGLRSAALRSVNAGGECNVRYGQKMVRFQLSPGDAIDLDGALNRR